jgi:WD40 repeat protein
MVFSFDGRLLATGTNDGTVTLWDAMSDLEIVASTTAHTGPITGIAFGPSAKTLVTGSNKDEHLVQWEIAPDRSLAVRNKLLLIHEDAPLIYEGGAWNVISTPNGQLLAAGTGASTVALWDLAKGVRLPEIELSQEYSDVTGLSFSSQDGMLAVARGTGLVNLYSLEQNRWVGRLATSGFVPRNPAWQDRVLSIAYTSNGRILVGGLSSGHVVLWDTDGMVEIGHLIGSTSSMKKVVASPDGQTLIGIDSDNRAIRWEMNFRDLACRIANRSLSDSELRRYLGPDGLLPMDQRVCHR